MKKILFLFLVFLFIAAAGLVFTNPSEDELRKQAEFFVTERIERNLPASATSEDYASDLIHLNINQSLRISDYYFFKKVCYVSGTQTTVLGYGLLNKFYPAE